MRYAITPVNQYISDRISKRVTLVIMIGVAIMCFVVIANIFDVMKMRSATLIPVLFAGAMGGLLSMQQRYQSISREGDPIDNISELTQGWSRLFLPAISGSIFAAVLYMLIIGGLLQGDLFPTVLAHDIGGDKPDDGGLLKLLEQGRPKFSKDYAKLKLYGPSWLDLRSVLFPTHCLVLLQKERVRIEAVLKCL